MPSLAENGDVCFAPSQVKTTPLAWSRPRKVKAKGSKFYSMLQKTKLYEQFADDANPELNGSEFKLLGWIIRNAAGWGVPCITEVFGAMMAREVGISLRTVRRALPSLAEKGYITFKGVRHKHTTIWLNLVWKDGNPMLPIPKRLKNAQPQAEEKCQDDTYGWAISANVAHEEETPKYLPSVDIETTTSPFGADQDFSGMPEEKEEPVAPLRKYGADNVAADLAKVQQTTQKRVERKVKHKAKTDEQYCNADSIEELWQDRMEQLYPDIARPAWTGRERLMVRQIGSRWATNQRIVDFVEFVDWCVSNWPAIIRQQFGWMTKSPPPRYPSLRFWASQYEQFFECFTSGKLTKWMRAPERTRLQFFMARGMTEAQALFEVAKEQTAAALQEEMRNTRKMARDKERRVLEEAKRIERMQQFGGAAPVHPKSEAAKKMMGLQPVALPKNGVNLDELDASDIPGWEE